MHKWYGFSLLVNVSINLLSVFISVLIYPYFPLRFPYLLQTDAEFSRTLLSYDWPSEVDSKGDTGWVLPNPPLPHTSTLAPASSTFSPRKSAASTKLPTYKHLDSKFRMKTVVAVTMSELRRRLWCNPMMLFDHARGGEGPMREVTAKQIFDIIRYVYLYIYIFCI